MLKPDESTILETVKLSVKLQYCRIKHIMIIECPRCHFKQPQDQYCANCGVDMLAYKPVETPTHEKVLRSGVFQFFIVIILGLVVSYAVVQTDGSQQWIQKINRFAGFKSMKNKKANLQEHSESSFKQNELQPQTVATPPPAAPVTPPTQNTTNTPVKSDLKQAPAAAVQPQSDQFKINITMYEINRETIEDILRKAQDLHSEGEVRIATLISNKDASNQFGQVLKSESLTIDKDQSKYVWVGSKTLSDPESMGFNFGFLSKRSADKSIVIDGILAKKHVNDNMKLSFKIPTEANAVTLIVGKAMMSYFEFDTELHQMPPFTIFNSDDFKNENSTFLIVIEAQK